MKRLLTCTVALIIPASLNAAEGEFSGGIAITSNYVSNGITQTEDGPAIQPFFENSIDGFYVGTWLSNVDFGPADDDKIEIDVYLGYRDQLESALYYDVGYARYLYDDSGDCCGEFKALLGYEFADVFALEGYTAYNRDGSSFNSNLSFAADVGRGFYVSGLYGYKQSNKNNYWHLGGAYEITDIVNVDLRYHGADSGDEGWVFTLSAYHAASTFERLLLEPFQR